MRARRTTFAAAAALIAAVGSACGGSTTNVSTSTPLPAAPSIAVAAPVASMVPAAIRAKGAITVAIDATYPPDEFVDANGTTIGWDVAMIDVLGDAMGLKVTIMNTTIDKIVTGVQTGKYDVGMSSIPDTKAREQQVDMVTYYTTGSAFVVRAHGGAAIQSLDDLCGRRVAVVLGTAQVSDAQSQAKACTSGGKPAVRVDTYGNQPSADMNVSGGKDDVEIADVPVAAYAVKQSSGGLRLTGHPYNTMPLGIAANKAAGLAPALLGGLQDVMSAGIYRRLLVAWGVDIGALPSPGINGATS